MKLAFFIFLLIFTRHAIGVDIPFEFVTTKNEMYLIGNPKEVSYQSQKSTIIYSFNKNGIVVKRLSDDHELPSMLLKFTKTRIKEIIEFSGTHHTSRDGGTFYQPLKYDDNDRVTAINKTSFTGGPTKLITPGAVTFISYEPLKQIHDTYKNRALASKKVFELSPDGRLLKLIEINFNSGEVVKKPNKTIEYGSFGPIKMQLDWLEIEYRYSDSILVSEISKRGIDGPVINTKLYADYALDKCGNWISRKVHNHNTLSPSTSKSETPIIEKRVIEYYSECA